MSAMNVTPVMTATARIDRAGSECCRLPLVPGVQLECPCCSETLYACTGCQKLCRTVTVGTEDIEFKGGPANG